LNVTGAILGHGAVNVNDGWLAGDGSIAGAVMILPPATLSPGNSLGTMTLQSDLTIAGNLAFEVDKSTVSTNDFVQVNGTLLNVGTGTITITNLGPEFESGDRFKFFNQPLANGNALTILPVSPGPGLAWTNDLSVDGTVRIISVPMMPTPADLIGLTLSAGTLMPAFNSNRMSYTARLVYTNESVTLNAVAANPGATIRIFSAGMTNTVESGESSEPIPLKPGENFITISVTAPDDSLTKNFVVSVIRTPPNIVLILGDDQGFSDWGCYGSEIPTPNLDQLASEGIRFRRFYNTARCSTTRCSLLTGLYTQQVAVDPGASLPNLRTDNNVTIAELLQANGYRTYLAGKWHLGNGIYLPEKRGFEQVWRYGDGGAHSLDNWNANLYTLISQNNEITNRTYGPGEFYRPDAIGDYSVDFLNNHQAHQDGKPFFLFLAFGSAHFPLQAPKNLVNSNTPVYAQGWDVIREQRYEKMLANGIIDARYPLSPRVGTAPWSNVPVEAIPAWNTLPSNRQADLARRMAVYAAMVQKMDETIGRVVEKLRADGQLENTLIFALSDNGGNHEGGVFGWTGGVANASPLTGAALDNMGQSGQPVIYLGGGWANVQDTPFRLFKHFEHEGGVRTPLIVHWPQGITRTNEWEEQPGHLIDIMATIVDVTGANYPTQYNGHEVLPLEGQSLKPLFAGAPGVSRKIGFEHEGNRAWLEGNWKLVTKNFTLFDGSSPANELELYDLNQDPVEMTNLATSYPSRVAQMATNWNAWAARVGVPANRFITLDTNPPAVTPAPGPTDLFLDTFSRGNHSDVDVSAFGMSGDLVPPLGAGAAYYEGFEGSGSATSIQINNGALQMAVGAGMSETGIRHNFIDPEILAAGGFSIEMTIQKISSSDADAANRYAGFGVGLSEAEAATGGDVGDSLPAGAVCFRGKEGGNTGVTDFFVELDLNGNVKVWSHGVLLETVPVGQSQGTLSASFAVSGFGAVDPVVVNVFFNGQRLDINSADANSMSRSFNWNEANENYIGLSARASDYAQLDNFAIRKLPIANALATGYALRHGLSEAESALDADPDGDGVSNFGEWAFGGDPTASDPFLASLKGMLITPTQDFRFEFQRVRDYAGVGLRYRYFVSNDLKSWTEATPDLIAANENEDHSGYEIVTLQLPASSLPGENKLFLRVLAEPAN
jgi:arylsulfatase